LLTFEVAPQPLRELGLVMKMGPITALQENSPAEKAGFKPGDRIESIDGKEMADVHADRDSWTPLTLPAYLQRAAIEGREVV
jgi:C-terminal processing protease CtpA/Prc